MQMTVKGCPIFLQMTGPQTEQPIIRYSAKYCQRSQGIKYLWNIANTHTCFHLFVIWKGQQSDCQKYNICFYNTNTFVFASIIRRESAYKPSQVYQQSLFWVYSHRSSLSPASPDSVELETGTQWQLSSSLTVHFSLSVYLDQEKCSPKVNRGRGRFKPSHTARCICTSGWGVRAGVQGRRHYTLSQLPCSMTASFWLENN